MTPVSPRIGIALAEIIRTSEEVAETPTPSGRGKGRSGSDISIAACVFDIEDTHLRIAGTRHQGTVIGMRHKLDGEDVGPMPGEDGSIQGEGGGRGLGLIGVDIQM